MAAKATVDGNLRIEPFEHPMSTSSTSESVSVSMYLAIIHDRHLKLQLVLSTRYR